MQEDTLRGIFELFSLYTFFMAILQKSLDFIGKFYTTILKMGEETCVLELSD